MSDNAFVIPRTVINEVGNALGYVPEVGRIKQIMDLHFLTPVEELRKFLKAAKAEFNKAGGRGVELADRVDDLRVAVAIKKATAKGWNRPVRDAEVKTSSVDIGEIKTLRDLRRRTAEEQYQSHVNNDEEADIVESNGFSPVGANKMRCNYWIPSSAKGRLKKVTFTVIFAADTADVEDTEVK